MDNHNESNRSHPKITIVTPSFNQGQFLEETICSVLDQKYQNLEYIIVDGGSTDGSVEIIKKYQHYLKYWVSEKDNGQVNAINKGLRYLTGDYWGWLNSDDLYMPNTLELIAGIFLNNPQAKVVYGSAHFIDIHGNFVEEYKSAPLEKGYKKMKYWLGWKVPQPSTFYKSDILMLHKGLDETYHYSLDYEWMVRIVNEKNYVCVDQDLAAYRLHTDSKTGDWESNKHYFYRECLKANLKYAPYWKIETWELWLSWLKYLYLQTKLGKVTRQLKKRMLGT